MEKFGSFENISARESKEKKKTRFERIRKYALVGLGTVVVGHSEAQVLDGNTYVYEKESMAYTEHHEASSDRPLTFKYVLALNHVDESKKWSPELNSDVDALVEKVGVGEVERVIKYDAIANIPGLKVPVSTEVSGFDGADYISDDDIKGVINPELFPYDWLTYIQKVSFESRGVENKSNAELVLADDFNHSIVVYDIDRAESVPEEYRHQVNIALLGETLRHEVCHANDWATLREVSFIDRISLLQDVIERVESDDAYSVGTVEDTSGNAVPYHALFPYDTEEGRNRAYNEYFGEICSAYLSRPDEFQEKHPKDYKVVSEWIQKYDPQFAMRVDSLNH